MCTHAHAHMHTCTDTHTHKHTHTPLMVTDSQLHGWAQPQDGDDDDGADDGMESQVMNHWNSPVMSSHH